MGHLHAVIGSGLASFSVYIFLKDLEIEFRALYVDLFVLMLIFEPFAVCYAKDLI